MSHRTKQRDVAGFGREAPDAHNRPEASSSPRPPMSSPSTPAKSAVRPRDAIIAASDDEGDDGSASDDSLEDLATILGTRRPDPPSQPIRSIANPTTETPRAKRTALELPSSPLTLNPKVHKFDLNALAKAARIDDAISASSARAKAATEDMARQSAAASKKSFVYCSSDDEDEEDRALVGIVTDNAGDDAHKVLRAVKRAEQGGTHARYCFFASQYTSPSSTKPPAKIKGPWRILTQGNVAEREDNMASGLPQTLVAQLGQLPDEIFEWMLDEICVQESALLRLEYCNLVAQCPSQVETLLTPERLEQMVLRLGASPELKVKDSPLSMIKVAEDPYADREWSCLTSFLFLLGSIASSLSVMTTTQATQILLRMSMDPVILQAPGLLEEYRSAIAALVNAIPLASWDAFCLETCSVIDTLVKMLGIRTSIVICLPVQDPRAHELRRRLAIAFFLKDTPLSGLRPAQAATLRDLINRLHSSDFLINHKTDFSELQSNILLLDAAIDDGYFAPASGSSLTKPNESHTTLNQYDDAAFDAEIDELADHLRGIWRKINDAGLKLARTEAKGVIEWVQQRLSHSVRTKKKLRKSVFDLDGGKSLMAKRQGKDDPFLPKQQDYMKNFLKKSGAPTAASDGG